MMFSNVFTHRNTVGVSLAQFPQTKRRAHGKFHFPTLHPWLGWVLALVPGSMVMPEFGCHQPDWFLSVCQGWPSLELLTQLWRSESRSEVELGRSHWCWFTSALLLHRGFAQWSAGSHQSILPQDGGTQEQRNISLPWNSRISSYSTPQSILTSFGQVSAVVLLPTLCTESTRTWNHSCDHAWLSLCKSMGADSSYPSGAAENSEWLRYADEISLSPQQAVKAGSSSPFWVSGQGAWALTEQTGGCVMG